MSEVQGEYKGSTKEVQEEFKLYTPLVYLGFPNFANKTFANWKFANGESPGMYW